MRVAQSNRNWIATFGYCCIAIISIDSLTKSCSHCCIQYNTILYIKPSQQSYLFQKLQRLCVDRGSKVVLSDFINVIQKK